jgi:acyl-coenzyme A synthetase/AMP-(fatty) acid ligase
MIFTSGTTGSPRAVMHAHRAIWARRMMHGGWMGLGPDDRVLHPGAFNWTYTLGAGLLDPWTVGAVALIPAPGVEPGQLPLLLRRFDATIFAAAPGVYRQMLRAPMPPLPRLRHGLSAGEALPEALRAAWEAATGVPVFEAFGLSECSTFVSGSPDRPAPAGSTGYAQPGRQIAVLDDAGRPVPPGTPGVLAVHRSDPGLFLGYFNAPQDTAARFRGDWFVTGDTVQTDPDGALRYLGRDDDMMNAGGYRVSPVEVEEAMLRAPGITDCAAAEVAVRADARVIACFYASAAPLDEAALARHAAQTLARYKQPRLFIRLPALPRGANNKLRRRDLRQTWEAAHGQA